MTQSTSEFWDAQADRFDSIYRDDSRLLRWFNSTFRKAVYDRFRIALRESGDVIGKSVLDIGCGSGRYMVEYAKRGASRVVGIDFSGKMLDLARNIAAGEGVQDRCEFVEGDFSSLELNEEFDIVLAMGVFDYIADPQPFLTRMTHASRGLVIASFPGKSRLRMHLRKLRYKARGSSVYFYTEASLRDLAAKAGLRDLKLVFMPHSGTAFVLIGSPDATSE